MEKKAKKYIPEWLKGPLFIIISIIASVTLLNHPVFSFKEDKGILYVRSFSMDSSNFYVIQTNISNGVADIIDIMPVSGLHICAWAMVLTCVAALLCFWDELWRMRICIAAIVFAGAYYILMIYYAVEITDEYYSTLYPNLFALLPAVVMHLLLIVRKDIAHMLLSQNENEEKEEEIIEEE